MSSRRSPKPQSPENTVDTVGPSRSRTNSSDESHSRSRSGSRERLEVDASGGRRRKGSDTGMARAACCKHSQSTVCDDTDQAVLHRRHLRVMQKAAVSGYYCDSESGNARSGSILNPDALAAAQARRRRSQHLQHHDDPDDNLSQCSSEGEGDCDSRSLRRLSVSSREEKDDSIIDSVTGFFSKLISSDDEDKGRSPVTSPLPSSPLTSSPTVHYPSSSDDTKDAERCAECGSTDHTFHTLAKILSLF